MFEFILYEELTVLNASTSHSECPSKFYCLNFSKFEMLHSGVQFTFFMERKQKQDLMYFRGRAN